jgi:uncharacterized membrane protein YkvA (DUF1232 family)
MGKRLAMLWSVIRGDARRLWWAWRHPLAPRWLKPAVLLLALYLISPLDVLPDWIPLLGIVDDLVLIPLVMRFLLARLPATVRADIDRKARPAA